MIFIKREYCNCCLHEEDIAKHAARIIRLFDGEIAQDYRNENICKSIIYFIFDFFDGFFYI